MYSLASVLILVNTFNRKIWTRIERARAMAKVNSEDDKFSPSFDSRILLLSTTHFGLATPVLNIQREKTALELSNEVIKSEISALPETEKLTIYNTSKAEVQCIQLEIKRKISDVSCLTVQSDGLESFTAVPTADDNSSVFLMIKFAEIKDKYELEIGFDGKKEKNVFGNLLKTDRLSVMFSPEGNIEFIKCDERVILLHSIISLRSVLWVFMMKTAVSLLQMHVKCSIQWHIARCVWKRTKPCE